MRGQNTLVWKKDQENPDYQLTVEMDEETNIEMTLYDASNETDNGGNDNDEVVRALIDGTKTAKSNETETDRDDVLFDIIQPQLSKEETDNDERETTKMGSEQVEKHDNTYNE